MQYAVVGITSEKLLSSWLIDPALVLSLPFGEFVSNRLAQFASRNLRRRDKFAAISRNASDMTE
jgi:hypothetical protein